MTLACLPLLLALSQAAPEPVVWVPLTIRSARSIQGATLELLADGSVRASGTSPETDRYVVEAETDLYPVTAVKLEVLPDDTLPNKGPGRADNGNFVLHEVRLLAAAKGSNYANVGLGTASASFEQGAWPAVCATDENDQSGWAILPQTGRSNAAVFELRKDLVLRTGANLQFEFDFNLGSRHTIGHFRLYATKADRRLALESVQTPGEPWGVFQPKINAAIDRGVEWLIAQQTLDGSYRGHQPGYPSGQTALALYTLIKSGVSKEHPAVQRAAAFVRAHPPIKTYEATCHILALTALDHAEDHDRVQRIADLLVSWQRPNGSWGYPEGASDLSNTQYAAFGLRTAAVKGYKVPRETWEELAKHIVSLQTDLQGAYGSAGFPYQADPPGPKQNARTSSMTAAGVAVAQICLEQLGRNLGDLSRSVDGGIGWLTRFFTVSSNLSSQGPASGANLYYYLYGLERVGALTGRDQLGRFDWYQEGARFLVPDQKGNGSWAEGQETTCFALLFLERATAGSTGGGVSNLAHSYGQDDPKADFSLRAAGDRTMNVWISSWGDHVHQDLCFEGESAQGPRVVEVGYYLCRKGADPNDADPIAVLPADPDRPAGAARFAVQHVFDGNGEFEFTAHALIRVPGEEEPLWLFSNVAIVRVREVVEEHLVRYAGDAERNLLREVAVSVRGSSELSPDWAPNKVVDGLLSFGWLSKDGDYQPTLSLELDRPVRSNLLILTQTVTGDANRTARIQKARVTFNGKGPIDVTLDPDDQRKTEVAMPKTQLVRRIEIEVLETSAPQGVGFAEVELQLRRD